MQLATSRIGYLKLHFCVLRNVQLECYIFIFKLIVAVLDYPVAPHKIALRKTHRKLLQDFHLDSEIDKLIQYDVINRETLDEIKSHKSRTNQLRMFLLKLGSFDAQKFNAFLEVLKESHSHLAKELEHCLRNAKEDDVNLFEDDKIEVTCIRCQISRRVQPEEVIDELFSRGIIGATALRKYIDPQSEFKGSKIWKYVFENLKLLQRNKINVGQMMQEILEKNYIDIAEGILSQGPISWDCTCELHEYNAFKRLHSISNASSEITRKCASCSTATEPCNEAHAQHRQMERYFPTPTDNGGAALSQRKNPDIVITAEDDYGIKMSGANFDGYKNEIPPEKTTPSQTVEHDTKQLLKPPNHPHKILATYQPETPTSCTPDVTFKNPCFDDDDSVSPPDKAVKQNKKVPTKKDIWQKFFSNSNSTSVASSESGV